MLCCLGFFGTDIALCRAAWDLLVLEMHCFVLFGFCWYWQCIVSCCLEFVDSDIALCRAAWALLILAVHFVVLLGFC